LFFPLETKKTTFFAEILKILGSPALPSHAHGFSYIGVLRVLPQDSTTNNYD